MTAIKETVFSEYEVRRAHAIIGTGEAAKSCELKCIGSLEEAAEVTKITKKCRGKVAKERTRGAGNGTLKISLHMPYELYLELHGMRSDPGLIEGVNSYGAKSLHPEFAFTAQVFDEDEVEKLKAWPRCVMSSGPARKVENGAEEVAEIDAEISFMPDAYDAGMYEALVSDIKDGAVKTEWLEKFTPELVHVVEEA